MRTDADPGRLLADVEMQEAGRFALSARDLRNALEAAQENHLLEKAEKDIAVRQVGGGPSFVFQRR